MCQNTLPHKIGGYVCFRNAHYPIVAKTDSCLGFHWELGRTRTPNRRLEYVQLQESFHNAQIASMKGCVMIVASHCIADCKHIKSTATTSLCVQSVALNPL